MKSVALPLILLVYSVAASAQQGGQPDTNKQTPPQAMCKAAAPKLREAGTNEVVLTVTVDTRGRVQSFTTDSPKGLRLEKIKEASASIKALQFDPAKKDGHAVAVMVRVEFDCSGSATDASNEQQPR
ncbi:MAG: energy transducer TonB [Terriglobales bacterium]|jgi:TonB-like protein